MRSKKLTFFIGFYAVWYICTAFFTSNSVTYQTIDNVLILLILIASLRNIPHYDPQTRFLINVLTFFFLGQVLLYLVNWVRYKDFYTWLDSFNNYSILIPLYVVSLIGGIAYNALKKSEY